MGPKMNFRNVEFIAKRNPISNCSSKQWTLIRCWVYVCIVVRGKEGRKVACTIISRRFVLKWKLLSKFRLFTLRLAVLEDTRIGADLCGRLLKTRGRQLARWWQEEEEILRVSRANTLFKRRRERVHTALCKLKKIVWEPQAYDSLAYRVCLWSEDESINNIVKIHELIFDLAAWQFSRSWHIERERVADSCQLSQI